MAARRLFLLVIGGVVAVSVTFLLAKGNSAGSYSEGQQVVVKLSDESVVGISSPDERARIDPLLKTGDRVSAGQVIAYAYSEQASEEVVAIHAPKAGVLLYSQTNPEPGHREFAYILVEDNQTFFFSTNEMLTTQWLGQTVILRNAEAQIPAKLVMTVGGKRAEQDQKLAIQLRDVADVERLKPGAEYTLRR